MPSLTLREIAERLGGWVAPENQETLITSAASLTDADEGDLSFYGNPKYLKALRKSRATAVLVPHGFGEEIPAIRVWVDHPMEAFTRLLMEFAPQPITFPPGVDPGAQVAPDAQLGEGVRIESGVVIEPGVRIGAGTIIQANAYIGHETTIGAQCFIQANVTIRDRCQIGDRVILQPGVVIGSDGFGYEFRDGRQVKIPQTGIVQIDNDVEIGANSTVDRARFGRTWIQEGVKIDNLVQIAHNVIIGKHSIICAHVGISGSVRVGSNVTLAGKVGVNGHIEIGDGAIVTAMAGITKSVPPKEILVGLPAKPMREYKENYVLLHNIRKLYDRVKALEAKQE
ncbi:UDP-3-O-(3-hydroxymyristoyl)glucosamine N-acyltransferase [Spartobacteria bacterium LR76]|nr:UDP-3-O-(3-hydroxymyristoyl)glucosamine N-acyltransferase [Spartobacteria bacterium LR76]